MISTSAIMRTRAGITPRNSDTRRLDSAVTKIRPRHITTVFFTTFVTASVEQMPSTWTNTGFCEPRFSLNSFQFFAALMA
jgi:hypothetical protein